MSGIDFLAYTNFLIHISQKNPLVEAFLDFTFGISLITDLELLGVVFSISKASASNAQKMLDNCFIFEMNSKIKQKAILLKQSYKIKLPDAIIAATAIVYKLPLITSDADFEKIKELDLIFLEK